jgi:hypothetical protein
MNPLIDNVSRLTLDAVLRDLQAHTLARVINKITPFVRIRLSFVELTDLGWESVCYSGDFRSLGRNTLWASRMRIVRHDIDNDAKKTDLR